MIIKIQIFEHSKCVDRITVGGKNWKECLNKLIKTLKAKGSVM
jgi:hypothetical protein